MIFVYLTSIRVTYLNDKASTRPRHFMMTLYDIVHPTTKRAKVHE